MSDALEITPIENFIFQRIKERYESKNRLSSNIDTSATNLVGWNGLIISVLLTGGGLLISKGSEFRFSMLEWSVLSLTLILLGSSLLLSFITFRRGSYYVVPDPRNLLDLYQTATASRTFRELTATMVDAIERNAKRNQRRTTFIGISQILFFVAMVSAIIFLIEQSIKLIG